MEDAISKKGDLPDTLAEVFSPLQLTMLSQISEAADYVLEPMEGATPESVDFATDTVRKIIYFNPFRMKSLPQYQLFALFGHELGHHFPKVLETDRVFEKLTPLATQLLPEEVAKKDKLCHSLNNVLLDVLLESTIPEDERVITSELLAACFRQNRGRLFLENIDRSDEATRKFDESGREKFPWEDSEIGKDSRFKQFFFISLVGPFYDFPDKSLVHPDVAGKYDALKDIFRQLVDPARAPEEKSHVFIEYVKIASELIDKDIEERTETSFDPQSVIESILDEIADAIARGDKLTLPSKEINKNGPNKPVQTDKTPGGESGAAGEIQSDLREKLKQVAGSTEEDEINEQAKLLEVPPEVYRYFLEIQKKYAAEIKSLTETLTKFVLREFERVQIRGQKEGVMVTPGREVETYQRLLGGEDQPATKINRKELRTPKTLQLYNLIDTSGSMFTDLEGTLGFYTVLATSALKIQQELAKNPAKYDTRRMQSQPVEIEVVGFDSSPQIVIPLDGKMTMKRLVQGFDQIRTSTIHGGGTNDERALKFEYHRMKLHRKNVLKVLSMITDGGGQGDGIEPILRQIEEDNDIFFMVNGVGSKAGLVKKFYMGKFRPAYHYHVYAEESENVAEAVTKLIAFVQTCIINHFGGHRGR